MHLLRRLPFLSLLAAALGASLHASVALAQSSPMFSVMGPSQVTPAGRVALQPAPAADAFSFRLRALPERRGDVHGREERGE